MLPEQRRALWTLAAVLVVIGGFVGTRKWRAYQLRRAETQHVRALRQAETIRLVPSVETWRNYATMGMGDAVMYRAWFEARLGCHGRNEFMQHVCDFHEGQRGWQGLTEYSDNKDNCVDSVSFHFTPSRGVGLPPGVNACAVARPYIAWLLVPLLGEANTAIVLRRMYADLEGEQGAAFYRSPEMHLRHDAQGCWFAISAGSRRE